MRGVSEVAVDPLIGKSDNLEKYEKPYHLNGTPSVNLASLGIMIVTSTLSGLLLYSYNKVNTKKWCLVFSASD